MYLKELTLRGFKSFASATTLRFEPGITAVVGPNGSGKSNIVDALVWVMGEQGAKTLRGSSMEDVIFAGTSSRPPLGRAQVSLTIDNSDHALDIEYTEVTISRTIFRSGGSEYSINGTPVRLLDVQELLSDTGLGSQMHVIVGQGRLSAILHADPAGHRAIIEEAAGILKHRRRKERSLRKLKSTQDNLARIDDLLTEINRQLGPLGRQARISRRAEGIQVSLRDAKARLLADDVASLENSRADNRTRLGEVRGKLATQQRDLARTKLRIENLEQEASASSPVITALTDSMHRLAQIDERYQSLSQLVEERRRSLGSQDLGKPTSDPEILEKRAAELESQVAAHLKLAQQLNVEQEKTTEDRAGKEAQLAGVRQTIAELRRTTKEREGNVARLEQLLTRQETMLDSSAKRTADFEAQRTSVSAQLEKARADSDAAQRTADSFDEDSSTQIDDVSAKLDAAKDALQERRNARQAVENQKIRLDARADALKDTVEQRRARASIASDERLHTLGSLASFIEVEEGWEDAIAKALSTFSAAIVVTSPKDLDIALEIAAENKAEQTALVAAGGAAFPAGRGSTLGGTRDGAAAGSAGADFDSDSGSSTDSAVRAAASLVRAHMPDGTADSTAGDVTDGTADGAAAADNADGILAAVRTLLDGVGVCETWEEGRSALAQGGWRIVITKSGEMLTPVGVVTAASSAPSDISLLARRQKALKESSELTSQLDELEREILAASESVNELSGTLKELTSARAERRIAAKQAATALQMQRTQMKEYERRLASISDSLESIEREVATAQAKKQELATALEQAQTRGDDSFSLEDFETKEHDLEQALATARDAEMAAKLKLADAQRKTESLTRQAQMLHDDAQHAQEQRRNAEERARKREAQLGQLSDIDAQISSVRELLTACISQTKAKREEASERASVHDEELTTLRGARNELEPVVSQLVAQEHELDVDRERFATQYGQLMQKVSDELGMQTDALVNDYGPTEPVPVLNEQGEPVPLDTSVSASAQAEYQTVPYNRTEQEKRLKKAEADLSKLGKVNPLATEEYDALQERHTYLNDQRNDVAASRDNLMQIVKDLDETMQRVFKEAFDDVAEAFEKIFAVLFPGGKGRLRLEDENDLLNTGVLVEASPAGKRVKQLTLLSGGEKSLTSLALLLAIFTARPSPFYVMDEVEAALDDLNLTRLLEALKQLREHAQLIIITHQQRTMAIADALYGITMRSDGVTAVISQKVDNK
jgi:chromosome segregation protein